MSERLRDVLAAHEGAFCICGELTTDPDAHVEAVVLAWLGELLGDAAVRRAVAEHIATETAHMLHPTYVDEADAALTAVRDALGVPVRPAGGEVAPGEAGDGKGAQIGSEGNEGDA